MSHAGAALRTAAVKCRFQACAHTFHNIAFSDAGRACGCRTNHAKPCIVQSDGVVLAGRMSGKGITDHALTLKRQITAAGNQITPQLAAFPAAVTGRQISKAAQGRER